MISLILLKEYPNLRVLIIIAPVYFFFFLPRVEKLKLIGKVEGLKKIGS